MEQEDSWSQHQRFSSSMGRHCLVPQRLLWQGKETEQEGKKKKGRRKKKSHQLTSKCYTNVSDTLVPSHPGKAINCRCQTELNGPGKSLSFLQNTGQGSLMGAQSLACQPSPLPMGDPDRIPACHLTVSDSSSLLYPSRKDAGSEIMVVKTYQILVFRCTTAQIQSA